MGDTRRERSERCHLLLHDNLLLHSAHLRQRLLQLLILGVQIGGSLHEPLLGAQALGELAAQLALGLGEAQIEAAKIH